MNEDGPTGFIWAPGMPTPAERRGRERPVAVETGSGTHVLWDQQQRESYAEGIYRGGLEAFASMAYYGEVTIMGRTVRVSFDWPDAAFAALVRDMARHVLDRAHAEGRQIPVTDGDSGGR